MTLQKKLLQTVTGLVSNNVERLPVPAEHFPEQLLQIWNEIPPAKFIPEKALQCFSMVRGGWQDVKPASAEAALKIETPTFGAVRFFTTYRHAVQMIKEMIVQASLLLNVGKNMHDAQAGPVAELIFETYKYFTVADFRAALKMGILGQFGSNYDRFDVQVISEWCTKYWEIRIGAAEMRSTVKTVVVEKDLSVPPPPDVQEYIDQLHKRVEKKYARPAPVVDDLMVAQWRTDWENGDRLTNFETYKAYQVQKLKRRDK